MDFNNNFLSSDMSDAIFDNLSSCNASQAWGLSAETFLQEHLENDLLENFVGIGKLDEGMTVKPMGCLVRNKNSGASDQKNIKYLGSVSRFSNDETFKSSPIEEKEKLINCPTQIAHKIKATKSSKKKFFSKIKIGRASCRERV